MNDGIKLLPCPFCGAPAKRQQGGEGRDKRYGCGCENWKCLGHQDMLRHTSLSDAAIAWNTRAVVEAARTQRVEPALTRCGLCHNLRTLDPHETAADLAASAEPVGTLECHLSGDATFWPDEDAVFKLTVGEHPVYVAPVAAQPQHPDDIAVEHFAVAMKAKLAQKRDENYGGWEDKNQCTAEWLSELLRQHMGKGDPVDVANFAMMLHQRGERITFGSAVPAAQPSVPDALDYSDERHDLYVTGWNDCRAAMLATGRAKERL